MKLFDKFRKKVEPTCPHAQVRALEDTTAQLIADNQKTLMSIHQR